jgi:hypothetical protein
MANIIGYNWDLTPIYGLPEATVTAKKSNKNTYQGPYNWDYYNAQNGTAVGKSWNEIAESVFGTPNVSEVFGGKPPTTPKNNIMPIIAIIAIVAIAIVLIKK